MRYGIVHEYDDILIPKLDEMTRLITAKCDTKAFVQGFGFNTWRELTWGCALCIGARKRKIWNRYEILNMGDWVGEDFNQTILLVGEITLEDSRCSCLRHGRGAHVLLLQCGCTPLVVCC
jgi:hypothetical protein